MFDMRRREFITLLSGAASWPIAASAQQAAKAPTIGFLGASTSSAWNRWAAAFVRRLGELGWIEGQNIIIEYRWAEGRSERFAEIAAEFVRLNAVWTGDTRDTRPEPDLTANLRNPLLRGGRA
jgi:putative tryptophan/tyrosine transport system substrate-binding protein